MPAPRVFGASKKDGGFWWEGWGVAKSAILPHGNFDHLVPQRCSAVRERSIFTTQTSPLLIVPKGASGQSGPGGPGRAPARFDPPARAEAPPPHVCLQVMSVDDAVGFGQGVQNT